MITVIDNTASWSEELVSGNAAFVETGSTGATGQTIYAVSNVRAVGGSYSFGVFVSDPFPPAAGPGASFTRTASHTFPLPTTTFDPVCCLDTSGAHPLIHILGAVDSAVPGLSPPASDPQLNDLVKFTYDTVTRALTGPTVLSSGSRIRQAYDIVALADGHTVVAACLTDPALRYGTISSVEVVSTTSPPSDTVVVTGSFPEPFTPGQWVLFGQLSAATFLDGALVQVLASPAPTVSSFSASWTFSASYGPAPDTGTCTPVGSSLLVMELDQAGVLVPGSAEILDSSPSRTGDTFGSVSLLAPDGASVELYYERHPKLFTFHDQVFTVAEFDRGASPPAWSGPTQLAQFPGRYTDDRLTALADSAGNRYLTQTYWSQGNHPEGIVGNQLVGVLTGSPPAWSFHITYGSVVGGSIAQGTLSAAEDGVVSLVYLLQPFDDESGADLPDLDGASWPLHVATLDPVTLGLDEVPGFYNSVPFSWLRGTKSVLDSGSRWAAVAERVVLAPASVQAVVPGPTGPHGPYVVAATGPFYENLGVSYAGDGPLQQVAVAGPTGPLRGQYKAEASTGRYTFGPADAGAAVVLSWSYVAAVVPYYVSLYNVPPVVALQPGQVTVWRGGSWYKTATDPTSPGPVTFSAANSTDADADAVAYAWTENSPDLVNVTLSPAGPGPLSTLVVARAFGPTGASFRVGAAAADLYPDGTQRHPAVLATSLSVTGGTAYIGYTAPSGAVPLAAGELVMPYGIALAAPTGPSGAGVTGGSLGAQTLAVVTSYVNGVGETTGSPNALFSLPTGSYLTVYSPPPAGDASAWNVYVGLMYPVVSVAASGGVATVISDVPVVAGQNVVVYGITGGPGGTGATFLNGELLSVAGTGQFGPSGATGFTALTAFTGSYANPTGSVGGVVGRQVLQSQPPVPLGTAWSEDPAAGLTYSHPRVPGANTAFLDFLNDAPVLLSSVASGVMGGAAPTGGTAPFPPTAVVGQVMPQFQFGVAYVTVPDNAPPTITFPSPAWTGPTGGPRLAAAPLARNTVYTVTPAATGAVGTDLPVAYGGIYDLDDLVTYAWTQTSGTPVALPAGASLPSLELDTSGTNVNGETLGFAVTVGDAVNAPVTASFSVAVAPHDFSGGTDTLQLGRSVWTIAGSGGVPSPIGQTSATGPGRNVPGYWTPPDDSAIYSDLADVKRSTTSDGSDRYLVISDRSVLVYTFDIFSSPENVFLRRLLTPLGTPIADAVQTEQDYTLVLDTAGHIYRYLAAPLLSSDSPDVTLTLSDLTNMDFTDPDLDRDVRLFTTPSFGGARILVVSGEAGAVVVQVDTSTLRPLGILEFTVADDLLYGADSVQFVRGVGVDDLRSGKLLIGTVAKDRAAITGLTIGAGVNNALVVAAQNSFSPGDVVVFSGLGATAAFLNGVSSQVYSATGSSFLCSYQHAAVAYTGPGLAVSQNSGTTYETLIDLAQGRIVRTLDKSKLRNKFVNTGEIMFQPDSAYAGKPIPPTGLTGSAAAGVVTLSWTQERPDLVSAYTVEYTQGTAYSASVPRSAPYTWQVPNPYTFDADEGVTDLLKSAAVTATSEDAGSVVTVTAANSFAAGSSVLVSGLTGAYWLNGAAGLVVGSPTDSQFTVQDPTLQGATGPFAEAPGALAVVLLPAVLAWDGTVHYQAGQQAAFGGFVYQASTTTFNQEPDRYPSAWASLGPPAGVPLPASSYSWTANGLYTFSAAQAGDVLLVSTRLPFQVLQNVNSGSTQKCVASLARGATYYFRVQAYGRDGVSGWSQVLPLYVP